MEGKNIKLIALLMALACLASGCSKGDEEKEEPHTLKEYALGGETVAALQPEEEDVQGVKDLTQVYRYSGLEDAGATEKTYVDQLTSSENGFSVVDANFVRTEQPDFTQESGTVRLARRLEVEEEASEEPKEEEEPEKDEESAEDKKSEEDESSEKNGESEQDEDSQQAETAKATPKKLLVTVQIDWRAGNCVVTVDQKEGSITSPPKKTGSSGGAKTMTLSAAVDHFKSISPASLGLSGASMEEYHIQSQDGVVMVDGEPCMQLRVYSDNNVERTNELMGNFLMTSDGAHIYRLNEAQHSVQEIKDVQMIQTAKEEQGTPKDSAAADQADGDAADSSEDSQADQGENDENE